MNKMHPENNQDLEMWISWISCISCIQKIIKIWKCTLTLFRVWPRKLSFRGPVSNIFSSAIAGTWTKPVLTCISRKFRNWVTDTFWSDLEKYLFRGPGRKYIFVWSLGWKKFLTFCILFLFIMNQQNES